MAINLIFENLFEFKIDLYKLSNCDWSITESNKQNTVPPKTTFLSILEGELLLFF